MGEDDQPIEQDMRFSQLMGTLGVKMYPASRGRAIGQLAWIPRRTVPYFGVTGGLLRYSFEQVGEFIDFDSFGIFEDHVSAGGWTPVGQILAGVEIGFSPRTTVRLETRFTAARDAPGLDQDYYGYDSIDLMGLQATAGVALRF